jgi:hypothetical protein
MNLRKLFHPIIIFTCGILLLTISIVFFVYNNNEPQEPVCVIVPQAFCGTKNLPENAQEGKKIFNANCTACHKLDARATGPGLRSVDSVKYWKWLSSKNIKIDTTKLEKLGIDYHLNYFSKSLTKEDLENIYYFTRLNK